MEIAVGTGLDRAIILIYFAMVMGFGAYFGKYSKTTSDYFFGGRRFSWWLITISIVATGIGSHSFVKYSTKAYQYGFSSTMTYMNDWFFMPLFMFGWLPIIYYSKVRSIPEYFERRFNKKARLLATTMILLYMIGYIAIQLLTLATALYKIYNMIDDSIGKLKKNIIYKIFNLILTTHEVNEFINNKILNEIFNI